MVTRGYLVLEWSNCIDVFIFFQLSVVWQDSHVPLNAPLCGSVWQSMQASNFIPVYFTVLSAPVGQWHFSPTTWACIPVRGYLVLGLSDRFACFPSVTFLRRRQSPPRLP